MTKSLSRPGVRNINHNRTLLNRQSAHPSSAASAAGTLAVKVARLRSNAALVDTAEGLCTSSCCLQKAAALQFLGHTASLPDALLENVESRWVNRGECGSLAKAPAILQPLPSTGLLPCQGSSIAGTVNYSGPSSETSFFILD